jgi:diguanylate cyclase (GGDEF)-like protein
MLLTFWRGGAERRRDVIEAKLQESAITDSLTGMRNRTAFIEHLEQAVLRARRENRRFGLLFVDIDDFKRINDSLGHAVGDTLLREVARRIEATVRGSDIAARLGGDEFIVLVDNCTDVQILAKPASRRLPSAVRDRGHDLAATLSIGAALYPEHGADANALMRSADFAMYRAPSRKAATVWSPPTPPRRSSTIRDDQRPTSHPPTQSVLQPLHPRRIVNLKQVMIDSPIRPIAAQTVDVRGAPVQTPQCARAAARQANRSGRFALIATALSM